MEENKGFLNPDASDFMPKEIASGLNSGAASYEPDQIIETYETHQVSHIRQADGKFEGRYGMLNLISGEQLATYDAAEDNWTTYNEWTSKAKLPEGKYARAVMTGPNTFVITGGFNVSALKHSYHIEISKNFGESINSVSVYEMNEARFLHSIVYFNSTVYVIAGQSSSKDYLSHVEAFENNEWVAKAPLNRPRSHHTAFCNNSAIWVAGGFSGPNETVQSIEKFAEGHWTLIEVEIQMLAGMTSLPRDRFNTSFLLLGGSDGNTMTDRVLNFNTESSRFEIDSTKLLVPRAGAASCWFGNSYWIIGGGHLTGEVWTNGSGKETKSMPVTIYTQIESTSFNKSRD